MSKIAEVIELYPGMSNTVNLSSEFLDVEKNRRRMEGYKPIKSHRNIFLKIAKSFLPNQDKVHLLVGQYGTGKSHLLLMLANYFSNSLDMPELKTFFENFDLADNQMSRQIQNLRGEGRYLVVIPDYESLEDFSENLISAVEEAFTREEFDEEIDSIYKESIRTIERWKKNEDEGSDPLKKYTPFLELLEKESSDYKTELTLKEGLNNYERAALLVFKKLYKQLIGTSFRYDATNIVNILQEIIKSKAFKDRFKGIVFLYDEFDHTLKNRRISIEVVQQFAELCRNSNSIMFIGSLHKELSAFANEYSVEDFRTVQQRFKTIDMKKDGLEEIASAIVNVKKDSDLYKEQIAPLMPSIYNKIPNLKQLNLFSWLPTEEIRDKIIDAVYPLHPLTMACLLELSTTIGSSNRTLFTFLGGEGIDEDNSFSYKSFINSNEILDDNDLLVYYTADMLVDYFSKELDINNTNLRETIKRSVISYQSSLKEYKSNISSEDTLFDKSDKIYEQILRLMLVYEIVGIASNKTNLAFGLNLQLMDEHKLESALNLITQQKVIFFNRTAAVYEFRRASDIDWDSYINTEKQNLVNSGSVNVAEEMMDIARDTTYSKILDAKRFNSAKDTDKRLLRRFESIKNFGNDREMTDGSRINYFEYHEKELIENKNWKENYDGLVIYVIVETQSDILKAKEVCKTNNSDYILVVIPEHPISVQDAFLDLKAAINLKETDDFRDAPIPDQARLEENYIGDINKGYTKSFIDIRNKYLSGKQSTWCGSKGNIIESKPNNEQDPIFNFLNKLYHSFNEISDEDLNRSHKALSSAKKLILRDAIISLLESSNKICLDTNYGNDKGFIRYLKKVFYDKQLLKKIDQNGKIIVCEIEKDVNKYSKTFPAIKDMIEEINNERTINLLNFVTKHRVAPYGLGEVSLELFFAFILKYFGDELIYKENQHQPGEVLIQSFEQIEKIINETSILAVFEKRKFENVQKELLKELYQLFSTLPLTVDQSPRTKEVTEQIKNWYDNLPKVTKVEEFYSKGDLKKFLQLLKKDPTSDPYSFIFEELQVVVGYENNDKLNDEIKNKIIEKLLSFKKEIEEKLTFIEENILSTYLKLFNVKGSTFGNLETVINEWYNSLDNNQRDLHRESLSKNGFPLIKYLKDTSNLKSIIYNDIPASNDYGLGKVKEWNSDNTNSYSLKLEAGLKEINDSKILVSLPQYSVNNGDIKLKTDCSINIEYENRKELVLVITTPQDAEEVWIGYDCNDPTPSGVQKKKIKDSLNLVPTKSNQTISAIAIDKQGNYSQILLINLKEKFVDKVKENVFGYEIDRPTSIKELKLTMKDIILKFIENDNLKKSEVLDSIDEIIQEMKDES